MKVSLRIGEISLSEIIAYGSIGEIWRGTHCKYHYPIALKQLGPTSKDISRRRQELEHEITLIKRLSHPGIVSIYDTQTINETPILAMEVADNSLCDTRFIQTWSSLRDLLLQVLQALAYLHDAQITHCDIKPANILRFSRTASQPTYKLIDFGIAQLSQPQAPTSTTSKREYRGSPAYSAPEQILGDFAKIGPWTDLYALGCTAYELATGAPPFGTTGFIPLTQRHLNDPPAPIHPRFDIPVAFNDWLLDMMRKNPVDRFPNAEQALQALLSIPEPPSAKSTVSTVSTEIDSRAK